MNKEILLEKYFPKDIVNIIIDFEKFNVLRLYYQVNKVYHTDNNLMVDIPRTTILYKYFDIKDVGILDDKYKKFINFMVGDTDYIITLMDIDYADKYTLLKVEKRKEKTYVHLNIVEYKDDNILCSIKKYNNCCDNITYCKQCCKKKYRKKCLIV